MSLLPTGAPLESALPDLEELLHDPDGYLRAAPLSLGPPNVAVFAALLAGLGGLLLSSGWGASLDNLRVGVGLVVILIALGLLVWSLMLRGYEMVLRPDGVELIDGDTSVWAPWEVFHVRGRAVVSDRGPLVVPINAAAVDRVELRRGGRVEARGREVASRQWHLLGPDEAMLAVRYQVRAQDVAELLQFLGRKLGQAPPPGQPEPPPIDPAGWFVVPLAHLRLPPCCTSCGGTQDDVLRVRVMARGDTLLGPFLAGEQKELAIPVCASCKARLERGQRWGGMIGLASGAVLGALAGGVIGGLAGDGARLHLVVGTLGGLMLGALVGSLAGLSLTRLPVRLRRYSPSRGVVSVQFESPAIAARVLGPLRHLPDDPTPSAE